MDKLNNYLLAIEDIIATQSEKECRRNIFETIDGLIEEFPDKEGYIKEQFNALCVKYKKDFFFDLRVMNDNY